MNNPLELLLRKQKMAQGGRIGFSNGGGLRGLRDSGMVSNSTGYGPAGAGGAAMGPSGNQGNEQGGNNNNNVNNIHTDYSNEEDTTTTTPVKEEEEKKGFVDFFKGLFTPPTAKEQFVSKVKYNPKLNRFIKETYGVESVDDLTDAQVKSINDYNNLSYNEIKDALSNMTMSAITNPLGATYNAATLGSLGLTGIGMTGLLNAGYNVLTGQPSYSKNLDNMDVYGNYIGPMSTNPAVNQEISDMFGGLTEAQMAEAAAKAISDSQTGGIYGFGGSGSGPNNQNPQITEQETIQNYMNSLTESELDKYNQLIEQGYTDEYAKAYLGML